VSHDRRTVWTRTALCLIVLMVLAVLLSWAGTLEDDPGNNSFAEPDAWGENPTSHLGERVYLNGYVKSTDPLIVTVEYGVDSEMSVTVEGGGEVSEGAEIGVFGTLSDARTIEAERVNTRDRWEAWYMYAVSLVGVFWVLGRVARDWKMNKPLAGLIPRGDRDA